MTAYSRLQEKEFSREAEYGYQAVKHQRFVGTGYFDALTQVIAGGLSSTTALEGSTEQEQFTDVKPHVRPKHGPDAACQPILGRLPVTGSCGNHADGGGALALGRLGQRKFVSPLTQRQARRSLPLFFYVRSLNQPWSR